MEEVLWMESFRHLSNVLDASIKRPEFESFFADHIRKLILAAGKQDKL